MCAGRTLRALLAVALVLLPGRSAPAARPPPPPPPEPPPRSLPCAFNSMCSCATTEVACVGVPLYRLPGLPRRPLDHVEVLNAGLSAVEDAALAGLRVSALRLISNSIIHISPHALSPLSSALRSLDLSYNQLHEVPFSALQPLQSLHWLSLHGNHIAVLDGDWSHLKETLTNLYLGENDLTHLPDRALPPTSGSGSASGSGSGTPGSPWGSNDVMAGDGLAGLAGSAGYASSASLAGLRSLQTLELDGNKLGALPVSALPASLRSLSAQHNAVARLPGELLALPHLQHVLLRANLIRTLPRTALPRRRAIERLDLGENSIQILPSDSFNRSLAVRELHLDQNYIKELPGQAFRGFNTLRLHLAGNRIHSVHDEAFSGLEATLEHLDLDSNALRELPVRAMANLTRLKYLYLAKNRLTDISDGAMGGFAKTLKALSISGNELQQLPVGALSRCRSLSHLDAGYNAIAQLRATDLQGWASSLDTLLLQNNRIAQLGPHAFRFAPKLRELGLSFNKLHDVDPLAFADLGRSLQILEISFCFAGDDFPEEAFYPLVSLRWLALDNNNIRSLTQDALLHLSALEFLNLEDNLLSDLPFGLFNGSVHRRLNEIRLGYNNLGAVTTDTFSDLESLKTVVLSGNYIKTVQTGAFNHLPRLAIVLLCKNRIAKLQPHAFRSLPRLTHLNLYRNNLQTFSLSAFVNVSSPDAPLSLNVSWNRISELFSGDLVGSPLYVESLDLSHNYVAELQTKFLLGVSAALRRLDLSHNRLSRLDDNVLGVLQTLEVLSLSNNDVTTIMARAFQGCDLLQILVLSHNHVSHVNPEQFARLENLRVLDLSYNRVRTVPADAFANTLLERVDLSHNELLAVPSSALAEVGRTLRSLDLAHNHIEHLDSTVFSGASGLRHLDLTRNRLSFLPDNAFSTLGGLLSLRLGWNPLRANLAELLHYVHGLRELGLEGVGLRSAPPLPLPSLVALNLSCNSIDSLRSGPGAVPGAGEGLHSLRSLDLHRNRLTAPPTAPLLTTLDLSANPIQSLTRESFSELPRLQRLTLLDLPLESLEPDTFQPLRHLDTLRTHTWRMQHRLGAALGTAPLLRVLSLRVDDHAGPPALPAQLLAGALRPSLRRLELTGSGLRALAADSLGGSLPPHRSLTLQVSRTQLSDFPAALFGRLAHIPHLALDFRENCLSSLALETFYRNSSSWERSGTTLISGGMGLKGNPWLCDCSLSWLGAWLRRWLREVLQVHVMDAREAVRVREAAEGAVCFVTPSSAAPSQQPHTPGPPLLRLQAAGCRASALSAAAPLSRPVPAPAVLLLGAGLLLAR